MTTVKLIASLLTLLLLMAATGFFLSSSQTRSQLKPQGTELQQGSYTSRVETVLAQQVSKLPMMEHLRLQFTRFMGQNLQDGIFITENGLYQNIPSPNREIVEENTNGMLEFVYRYYIPTYTMLIPTACAIKQHDIPEYAQLFNQKRFIEDTYKNISGVITSVDVYSILFSAMDEYIYYRTHPELTGLGGYYVYVALGERLGIQRIRSLSQFEFEPVVHNFHGQLYQEIQFSKVKPDMISLYNLSVFERNYTMTRYEGQHRKTYQGIYRKELLQPSSSITNKTDVILGGPASRIDIYVDGPHEDKLLIFADETIKAFLPFLANHYGMITVVDLSLADEKTLISLNMDDYNQVLFSYSVDTFTQERLAGHLLYLSRQ